MKKIVFILSFCLLAYGVTPVAGEKLAKEQSFIYNASSAPSSLDPAKMEGSPGGFFSRTLFETLVISDVDDKIIPGAAKSWSASEDFKTWTFKLRKEAKWSDGTPVTAHDFVFAWQRLVDPKTASPYASYLSYMKLKNTNAIISGKMSPQNLGVEAKDDYTLVLHLEEPVPFADRITEFYVLPPVPKHLVEKLGDAWSRPENIVGNGAFKMQSYVVNEEAVFTKNPYYWDAKNVLLEKVTLLEIPNSSVAYTRYRGGGLDVSLFPLELLEKVEKEHGKELVKGPELCTYYYEFNTLKPPFNDIRVRKALSMALDRNTLTEKILKRGQEPAYTFSPSKISAAYLNKNPDWASWDLKKRYEEAIKLLGEAGYSKQNPLRFTLSYNTSEEHKKIAIAAAAMWKKNLQGLVDVKLQNQEWKTFLSTRRLGHYDIARSGWCPPYNEASSALNVFMSDSSSNYSGYKSKEFDEAINEAYRAKDENSRAAKYAKAEQILYTDMPIMPIYFYAGSELVKPYVRNYKIKPSKYYYFKDLYIVEP